MKKNITLKCAHRMMSSHLTLVSSLYKGKPNVLAVAWTMALDHDPPKAAIVIGEDNYSFECVLKTGEFVINFPPKDILDKVVGCGSVSGSEADKFRMFGLTPVPASKVKAPLIKECMGHLECKLIDKSLPGKYNLFLGEIVAVSADEGVFSDHWRFDKKSVRSLYHLGGENFSFPGGIVKKKRR